jgi:hypothetical protein
MVGYFRALGEYFSVDGPKGLFLVLEQVFVGVSRMTLFSISYCVGAFQSTLLGSIEGWGNPAEKSI